MIKCIATDMDGTLLGTDSQVSPLNKQAIEDALKEGIEVVVSTGRSYDGATYPVYKAGLRLPFICMNGAKIYSQEGKALTSITLSTNQVRDIVTILQDFHIYFEIYSNLGHLTGVPKDVAVERVREIFLEDPYFAKVAESVEDIQKRFSNLNIQYIDDYEKLYEDPNVEFYKFIILSNETEKFPELRRELDKIPNLDISSSGKINLEVTHKDAQKGLAVESFVKSKGISLKETMAIGDSYNDVSMLKNVGFAVAMGNAPEDIKDIADYVTDSNELDGFAKAVYKVIEMNKNSSGH